jgi:hypothetical protein
VFSSKKYFKKQPQPHSEHERPSTTSKSYQWEISLLSHHIVFFYDDLEIENGQCRGDSGTPNYYNLLSR